MSTQTLTNLLTRIALQILALNQLHPAILWLEKNPAAMRKPESLCGGIRIMLRRIRESGEVVSSAQA
jgi:hypothetical protein